VTGLSEQHPFGMFRCDAPALVESASDDVAAQHANRVDYTIVSGDWLRHHSDYLTTAENADAFRFVTRLAARQVPNGASIVAPALSQALGNNDVVPDYYFNYTNDTRPELFNMTATLREEGVAPASMQRTDAAATIRVSSSTNGFAWWC
jgi:hypothetical protein